MSKEELIKEIESITNWRVSKHKYTEILLQEYDSIEIRKYIWKKYHDTGDYFYNKLLKDHIKNEEQNDGRV